MNTHTYTFEWTDEEAEQIATVFELSGGFNATEGFAKEIHNQMPKPWKVGDRFTWGPLESDPIKHRVYWIYEIVAFYDTIVAVVWMNEGSPIGEWYRIVELDEATRVEESDR